MSILQNLIIAEIGSVHDGSFGNAKKLIEAAKLSGANCVKFQTHISKAETLKNAPNPGYFSDETRFEYFDRTGFSKEQWKELKRVCDEQDVLFMSSPFSLEAVDLLEEVGVQLYKVPSGEMNNIPLLEKLNEQGKPVILSSGMSSWEELDQAVKVFDKKENLALLQCTSMYPCTPEHVGLNIIKEMKSRYEKIVIGFSDHTMGYAAPFAAATIGAEIIEKHFTYSRLMYGSDAKHSMEPNEFKVLSQGLNEIWKMLDNPVDKNKLDQFEDMKNIFEKSIVINKNLKVGHVLTRDDLSFKKPGDGIKAAHYKEVLGKKLQIDVEVDYKLKRQDIE